MQHLEKPVVSPEEKWEELKTLFESLYPAESFDDLCRKMKAASDARPASLRERDRLRTENPLWYAEPSLVGMAMYSHLFGGTLGGVMERIDYLAELSLRYLHLMPLLDMPKGQNDGGYAVSDFKKVYPPLGTNEDLSALCDLCHEKGINVCIDLVLNHTSDEHEWAKKARAGDERYQDYYLTYPDQEIPNQFEQTVPQVFPSTAPGNFTFCPEMNRYVMTTFHAYQWDLNYHNPAVFCEMADALLFLANLGVDVFRLDAVPYLFKEVGTSCRNLPQVHTLVRMLRLICEIVCPSVILLGEVVMAPHQVLPYFGSPDQPQCHLLYNVTTSVCIWNSLATGDCRLLEHNLRQLAGLDRRFLFLNYIRCHDDIGWGLDEDEERRLGIDPLLHKKYLYEFYSGRFPGSFAKGELYNEDKATMDARNCGTCASLCGVQQALEERDDLRLKMAVRRHLLVYSVIFALRGIPMLYSGDEIGQLNDERYLQDPDLAHDSRFLHRGAFPWEQAAQRLDRRTPAGKIYREIRRMIRIRQNTNVFHGLGEIFPMTTMDHAVFAMGRRWQGETLVCYFNFSGAAKLVELPYKQHYCDLLDETGQNSCQGELTLGPYEYRWLLQKKEAFPHV